MEWCISEERMYLRNLAFLHRDFASCNGFIFVYCLRHYADMLLKDMIKVLPLCEIVLLWRLFKYAFDCLLEYDVVYVCRYQTWRASRVIRKVLCLVYLCSVKYMPWLNPSGHIMAHEDVAVAPVFVSAAGVVPETPVEGYGTSKPQWSHLHNIQEQ